DRLDNDLGLAALQLGHSQNFLDQVRLRQRRLLAHREQASQFRQKIIRRRCMMRKGLAGEKAHRLPPFLSLNWPGGKQNLRGPKIPRPPPQKNLLDFIRAKRAFASAHRRWWPLRKTCSCGTARSRGVPAV